MSGDLAAYTARRALRVHGMRPPAADAAVVVVGYRTAYDVPPAPGVVIVPFRGLDPEALARTGTPAMALIAVESPTAVRFGARISQFPSMAGPLRRTEGTEFAWYLIPVDPTPGGRFTIARGPWQDSGHDAVLTRTLTRHAPTAPTLVAIHDHGRATDRPRPYGRGQHR